MMTKTVVRQPRKDTVSRRRLLGLASGATAFTFWHRKAHSLPAAEQYVDRIAAERIADRAPSRPPILVDAQTHVWWRAGGIRQMSERGEHFLKSLAGSRAAVVGHPVPIADMGRVMFLEDVFLGSETDIAFLNSFGMRAAFDGIDLFPPREAAFIRSMAPSRIRVLGTVDPPDGASAVESLIYQCETIKIDGLKLYPPGRTPAAGSSMTRRALIRCSKYCAGTALRMSVCTRVCLGYFSNSIATQTIWSGRPPLFPISTLSLSIAPFRGKPSSLLKRRRRRSKISMPSWALWPG